MIEDVECFYRNHSTEPIAKLVRFLQTRVHPIDVASIKCVAFGEVVSCGSIEVVVGGIVIDRDACAARGASRSRCDWNGIECEGTVGARGVPGGLR